MADNAKMTSSDGDISFKSLPGLSFVLLVTGTVFFVLGFGSNSWAVIEDSDADTRQGLWQRCRCADMDSHALDGKLSFSYERKIIENIMR